MRIKFWILGLAIAGSVTAGSALWLAGEKQGFSVETSLPTKANTLSGIENPRGRALMSAVFDDDLSAVRATLRSDRSLGLTAVGNDNTSGIRDGLLVAAIARQNKPMVNLLLSEGVSPNLPAQSPPIMFAMGANDPWYLKRLLDAGANPNSQGDIAAPPLNKAAEHGNLVAMKILVQYGAKVTGPEVVGKSPLIAADEFYHFRAAEYLIADRADIWDVEPIGAQSLYNLCNRDAAIYPTIFAKNYLYYFMDELTHYTVSEELKSRERIRKILDKRGFPCPVPTGGELAHAVLTGNWPPLAARTLGEPAPSEETKRNVEMYWNADGSRKNKYGQ